MLNISEIYHTLQFTTVSGGFAFDRSIRLLQLNTLS